MPHIACSPALPEAEEYFPDQFPPDHFPNRGWIRRPASFPAEVWTTETTHRDGQQGGLPLTTEQSLRIYDLLCRFTGKSNAIRQAEYFVYRKQDLAGFRAAQERYAAGAPIEPTTWIRATVKDVKLIQTLGVKESGLLASISDYHVFHKFQPGGRLQAANLYLAAVQLALDAGIRPRLHLEDASRAAIDFIRYFVQAVLERAAPYPDSLRP
jgi:isopropylmalate/homocitrate/citramalate synthase